MASSKLPSTTTAEVGKMDHLRSDVSLDIIIVGAGLSGLATAISCSLSGHKVTVFESATALQEVGVARHIHGC